MSTCSNCGNEVERKGKTGPAPKFCNYNCCKEWHGKQRAEEHGYEYQPFVPGTMKRCVRCANEFQVFSNIAKYCPECRPIVNLDRSRENYFKQDAKRRANMPTYICERCGKEFKSYQRMHRHCPDCVPLYKEEQHRRRTNASRMADISGTINHRAQAFLRAKYGFVPPLLYEQINKQKVLERDGWRCGLCGEPIDKTLRYPHRRCATIDHRIALSAGGSHLYDNVQAAHFECNCSKGSKKSCEDRGGLQSLETCTL